ncbi:MAG: phenylalanine--tRNA ligase subunit beta [Bacilli bacterium]|jgi:phenylalanyl-tRNA synthetase beta chain
MRVKLNWLKELVDLKGISLEELVDKLSNFSTEIESVYKLLSGSKLTIGHVLSCVDHPDSDHLHVCQVDVKTEVLQIVCGAPNVAQGQYVIVAQNGAVLPKNFKIKRTKIRGVESNGMICSLTELGLETKYISNLYSGGIYYFQEEVEIGSDPIKTLELDDNIIELGLTPDRADLLSMLGVAQEVSAVFNRPLKESKYLKVESIDSEKKYIEVSVNTTGCNGYYAAVLKNVTIKPSPTWLASRLVAFGIRPINNVVDITNYILALYGQPLHAFDYMKLGKKIVVRNALEDEEIITLDDNKRILNTSDVVITDGKKPVVIAGIMGGKETEISLETKEIVLEAAVFDSSFIRKTSSRIGLRSESSIRFEKGVNLNRTEEALNYAIYLLNKYADAVFVGKVEHDGNKKVYDKKIVITEKEVENYLGIKVNSKDIIKICKRLGFSASLVKGEINVKVPNTRNDVNIKVDLIEEIARINGYINMEETLPFSNLLGGLTKKQELRRKIKHILMGLGLNEVVNYALVNDVMNKKFKDNFILDSNDISVLQPLSNEHKTLRKGIVGSLIENAKYNIARKNNNLAFFELGKVYYEKENKNYEDEVLGILLINKLIGSSWRKEDNVISDFYVLKGIINNLGDHLNIKFNYLMKEDISLELHPKRTAYLYMNNIYVGFLGELHPKYSKENDLPEGTYVAEIKLNNIINKEISDVIYEPVSKVPNMERDIAVILKKNIKADTILNIINKADKKLLKNAYIFDVYTKDNVGDDEKSVAIKLIFSSDETLTDNIVNKKVDNIVSALEKDLDAKLRQ